MDVSFNSFSYSPHFGAKSKEVKKADDIMRAATAEFPMLSYTRADRLYSSCLNPLSKNYLDSNRINKHLRSKIRAMRAHVDSETSSAKAARMFDVTADDPIICTLGAIKRKKIGNCDESAKAALAALYANCCYNSCLATPYYTVQFIDKKTGKAAAQSAMYHIDHVLTVTDMDKNKRGERDIILDPWLGFADYKSRANQKYLSLVPAMEKEDTKFRARQNLLDELREKDLPYNKDDYICKEQIFISEKTNNEDKTLRKLTACNIRDRYPNLMLFNRRKNLYGEEK